DVARGVGQIQVKVTTDSGNTVFEYTSSGTAETNNVATTTATATLAPYPDLQVANLQVDPATDLLAGGSLTVRWDDRNAGNRGTPGEWCATITIKNLSTGAVLVTAAVPYDPNASGNGSIAIADSR